MDTDTLHNKEKIGVISTTVPATFNSKPVDFPRYRVSSKLENSKVRVGTANNSEENRQKR